MEPTRHTIFAMLVGVWNLRNLRNGLQHGQLAGLDRKTRNLPHQPNPKRRQKFQDTTRKAAYATYTAPDAEK